VLSPVLRAAPPPEQTPPLAPAPELAPEPAAPTPSANIDTDVIGERAVADWAASVDSRPGGQRLDDISVYGGAGIAGALAESERAVRVVLRFDGVVVYRRSELPAGGGLPRRLVLDLDGVAVAPHVQSTIAVRGGGLARIRSFVLDQQRVRVSFDVEQSTAYSLFFLPDPYRVVMDFRAATSERKGRRMWTIVLDPGHGGQQPGARGPSGIKEAHVALALAKRVRQGLLRTRKDVRVILTRDEDRFITLEERAAIANMVDADLFVSIHLNASDAPDERGGVATFVLDTADDQAALRLAARENDTDAEGVSRLQLILASLYREDQVERSLVLAEAVQHGTLRGGRRILPQLNDRGVKRALFYVLVGARMPAVLLEASFITRREEAEALATDEYKQALADGATEGISRYLDRAAAHRP
jgi:N-acetylmuramoyl-L-alanine amidase